MLPNASSAKYAKRTISSPNTIKTIQKPAQNVSMRLCKGTFNGAHSTFILYANSQKGRFRTLAPITNKRITHSNYWGLQDLKPAASNQSTTTLPNESSTQNWFVTNHTQLKPNTCCRLPLSSLIISLFCPICVLLIIIWFQQFNTLSKAV